MGKRKLKPLRTLSSVHSDKVVEETRDSRKLKKKEKGNDDEEVEWEKIEENAVNSEEETDDSDDDEDIPIEGDLEKGTKYGEYKYTFDYNDMKSEYVESITTMLKMFLHNPTLAYEAACVVTKQGSYHVLYFLPYYYIIMIL